MREGSARRWVFFLLVAATLWLVSPHAAEAQWQIASKDEKQTLKFGILVQPQYEALETVNTDHYSQNLYIRRLRLIFGGKISDRWSFFTETDSPNIGKARRGERQERTQHVHPGHVHHLQVERRLHGRHGHDAARDLLQPQPVRGAAADARLRARTPS